MFRSDLSTGLAAIEVKHEGRNSRSSRNGGKPRTWRRAVAGCKSEGSRENGYSSKTERLSSIG